MIIHQGPVAHRNFPIWYKFRNLVGVPGKGRSRIRSGEEMIPLLIATALVQRLILPNLIALFTCSILLIHGTDVETATSILR